MRAKWPILKTKWPSIMFSLVGFIVIYVVLVALGNPAPFMPHRHCYLNNNSIIWTMEISDVGIFLCYMWISFKCVAFIAPRWHVMTRTWRMQLSYTASFIFLCGLTHLSKAITMFYPFYLAETWMNTACFAASVLAALSVGRVVGIAAVIIDGDPGS